MTRTLLPLTIVVLCVSTPSLFVLVEAANDHSANAATGVFMSSGIEREYILHVPKTYRPARPTSLVISMHGAANWPGFQMQATRWNELADEEGFLVVYPGGQGSGPKTWHLQGRSSPATMPDVVFISELIDLLRQSYNIDPSAIYANGLSNGGGMAYALSCTMPHRIAAFGAVGAAVTLPLDWCPDNRPAPFIAFHGTADRFTPYDGGTVWIAPRPFPSIPEWTERWAERNKCAPVPVETTIASDVRRREYCDCANNAGVVLYTIEDGGHTWPGGPPFPEWLLGKTTRNVDATREMWAFFSQHRLTSP